MKRFRKTPFKRISAFFYIAAAAIALFAAGKFTLPSGLSPDYKDIIAARVVDGDTLKLANGERVRLIGIDTPEMHESEKLYRDARKQNIDAAEIQARGQKAADFTRRLVEGKRVRLEFDVQQKDKYRRLLAYVYLPDGTFVNAEILRQGYAVVLNIPPNTAHADEFRALYKEAKENKRGLWSQ